MKYSVRHETEFTYDAPVFASQHVLRLKPRHLPSTQILRHHKLDFSIPGTEVFEQTDYFGNTVHELRLQARHESLAIHSICDVEVSARDEILLELSPRWPDVVDMLRVPAQLEHWEASQFVFPSSHVDAEAAADMARDLAQEHMTVLRLASELTAYIYREFTYQGGVTDIYTPVSQVIAHRQGVCQDFAHVAIACLRHLGLAARYVSGYILSEFGTRPTLVGAEASHAWISVYCPEFGWVDFDPTNNQMTSDQHIVLSWGRDYTDVAPSRGSLLGGGQQTIHVDVRVRPTS